MTVADNTKEDIIIGLLESHTQAVAIELKLSFQGKQLQANKVAERVAELAGSIDSARGELIDEWAEQSASIYEEIQQLSEHLSEIKAQLKRSVDNTQQIVDAVAHIDDLAFIAKRLLKP